MAGVDTSTRLRHAIVSDDLPLVQRLIAQDVQYLHNPDFKDKSNTSLHLAARLGLTRVAEYLVSLGHDGTPEVKDYIYSNAGNNQGISINTDGQCPLHVAAANSQAGMVKLLCEHFPQTINRRDREGRTPLLLAAGAQPRSVGTAPGTKLSAKPPEDISSIQHLLQHGADVRAVDEKGNTCLHNACAWGNLKAVRAFMQAGADPLCTNYAGWTPRSYSLTVQADVYFRSLINEFGQRIANETPRAPERRIKGGGAVRIVSADNDDDDDSEDSQSDVGRDRADSGRSYTTTTSNSENGLGIDVSRTSSWR